MTWGATYKLSLIPGSLEQEHFCFSFKEEKGNTFMTNDLPKVSCAETDHTDQVPCCLVWCLSSVNSLSSYWSFGCCSTMQTHHICFLVALPGFHHLFFFFLLLNTFFHRHAILWFACACVFIFLPLKSESDSDVF